MSSRQVTQCHSLVFRVHCFPHTCVYSVQGIDQSFHKELSRTYSIEDGLKEEVNDLMLLSF